MKKNKFEQYQIDSSSTFKDHTDIPGNQARLLDWCLGLSGETGEVNELLKHHVFHKAELDPMKLAKELGDVLWYISAIATTMDIKLSDIAQLNVDKLQHRYDFGGFDITASAERHSREADFKNTAAYKILEARIMKKEVPCNIIFIGPDGAGKTTISKQVAEQSGLTYHKCNYQQEDKMNLAQQLLNDQINIIYDRFYFPDDFIYSRIKRELVSDDYFQQLDKIAELLVKRNVGFIYVDASLETLKERSKVWADDYITTDHLQDIKDAYDAFTYDDIFSQDEFNHKYDMYVPMTYLNTDELSVEDCVTKSIQFIEQVRQHYSRQ